MRAVLFQWLHNFVAVRSRTHEKGIMVYVNAAVPEFWVNVIWSLNKITVVLVR